MSKKHETGIKLRVIGNHPDQPDHYSVKLDGEGKPYIITTWNKRVDITSAASPQKLPLLEVGFVECEVEIYQGLEHLTEIIRIWNQQPDERYGYFAVGTPNLHLDDDSLYVNREVIESYRRMSLGLTPSTLEQHEHKSLYDFMELLIHMNFMAKHIEGVAFTQNFLQAAYTILNNNFRENLSVTSLFKDSQVSMYRNLAKLFIKLRKVLMYKRHAVIGADATFYRTWAGGRDWVQITEIFFTKQAEEFLIPAALEVERRLNMVEPVEDYPTKMPIASYFHYSPWTIERVASVMASMRREKLFEIVDALDNPIISHGVLQDSKKQDSPIEFNTQEHTVEFTRAVSSLLIGPIIKN